VTMAAIVTGASVLFEVRALSEVTFSGVLYEEKAFICEDCPSVTVSTAKSLVGFS
jgi:hypothetical protein